MTETHYKKSLRGQASSGQESASDVRRQDNIRVVNCGGYSLGAEYTGNGWRFAYAAEGEYLKLLIYSCPEENSLYEIELDGRYKNGEVFSFELKGVKLDGLLYRYETEKCQTPVADIYARAVAKRNKSDGSSEYFGVLSKNSFDW